MTVHPPGSTEYMDVCEELLDIREKFRMQRDRAMNHRNTFVAGSAQYAYADGVVNGIREAIAEITTRLPQRYRVANP